jgi:hypothetical protein
MIPSTLTYSTHYVQQLSPKWAPSNEYIENMTINTAEQPTNELESTYNFNNYATGDIDFKMQMERSEHLQFQCSCSISNFKVLGKQLFFICFPPATCFMQISFHFFCKVCTTNMTIFFAWYLHVNYLHYKHIDIHVLRASPFHVYHTIETHITSVCKIEYENFIF